MGFFQKFKKGLQKTRENMVRQMEGVFHSFKSIDDELFEELEEILILSDVGAVTSSKICEELRLRVKEQGIKEVVEVRQLLKDIMLERLNCDVSLALNTTPSVILVIGVNGVGKTTTIGKLAAFLKREGKEVILGAADTFRAAAIEQLDIWAKRSECRMVKHEEGSDPASVVFDTITAAKKRGIDVAICDTAGRLHNKKNLMNELEKITRVMHKEAQGADCEILLVLDATTGQNGIKQAEAFAEAAGITGIVLTKLDGTAKGGVVLAIQDMLSIPIKFVGVGEQIDDLQPFDPKSFVDALFDSSASGTLEHDAENEETDI